VVNTIEGLQVFRCWSEMSSMVRLRFSLSSGDIAGRKLGYAD
jgi:hypothetical protein